MKKFISRFDNASSQSSLIGKSIVVGSHTVEVLDIIAEGTIFFYIFILYSGIHVISEDD